MRSAPMPYRPQSPDPWTRASDLARKMIKAEGNVNKAIAAVETTLSDKGMGQDGIRLWSAVLAELEHLAANPLEAFI